MVVYGFGNGCGRVGWLSGSAWSPWFDWCLNGFEEKENVFFGGKGWF